MDRNLHRYWIQFALGRSPSILGYGVTAYSELDAFDILRHLVFTDAALPPVVGVTADVDVRTLDQGHVVPNMGPPNWRGIWFPKGHDSDLR